MRLSYIHGLGALFTALVLFVRLHCTRKYAAKRYKYVSLTFPCGDSYDIASQESPDDSPCNFMYLHSFLTDATVCGRPKCKRDPDISIDGEVISVHPKELYTD